ncbi:MAG: hypothetical protein JWQ71_520 [Pedosphaera sp.]|nr:hypothetical protein [Pedosphaera sp.]
MQHGGQFFREAFEFFIQAGADVIGLGFEDESVGLIEDAIGEVEADAFGGGEPEFNGKQIVVASGRFVADMAFHHGEDGVGLLPLKERSSN